MSEETKKNRATILSDSNVTSRKWMDQTKNPQTRSYGISCISLMGWAPSSLMLYPGHLPPSLLKSLVPSGSVPFSFCHRHGPSTVFTDVLGTHLHSIPAITEGDLNVCVQPNKPASQFLDGHNSRNLHLRFSSFSHTQGQRHKSPLH